jgi:NAD(P)-dependent dehydrogenase (short-subunit alcohol dehydrogenase family)
MDKVVIITGASSGIGLAAARRLAADGDHVVIVGRDQQRLRAAAEEVRDAAGGRAPDCHRADFASLDDVRELGGKLRAAYDRVDVLASNAGAAPRRAVTTADGFDLAMQVNHLAGFLLSHLLRDRMAAAGTARLITTSSLVERRAVLDPGTLSPAGRKQGPRQAYAASKQANILFTAEAARRWASLGIIAVCFHPGIVRTRLADGRWLPGLLLKTPIAATPDQGADTLVWLAAEKSGPQPGGYYAARRLRQPSAAASDPERARRLWQASLAATGIAAEDSGDRQ